MLIRSWLTGSGFCYSPDEGGGGGIPADSGTPPAPESSPVGGEPAASPTDSPSDSPFSFREYGKGAGWTAADQYPDDRSAAEALFDQHRRLSQEYSQYRGFYNQHAGDLAAYREWKAQQAAQQNQPPAPAQPEKPKWNVPEWDPEWLKMVQEDESGNLVPRHQWVSPELPQKIATYRKWQAENLRNLLHSPGDWIKQHIEDYVSQSTKSAIEQYQQSVAPRFDLESFVHRNADWMYQYDDHGRPIVNPETGLKMWSREGGMFANNVKQFATMFPDQPHTKVMEAAAYFTNQQIEASKASGTSKQPDSRVAANNGVPPRQPDTVVTRRGGSTVSAAANRIPQNSALDLKQMMKQNMEAAGIR